MIYPTFSPSITEDRASKYLMIFSGLRALRIFCTTTGAIFLLILVTTSIFPDIRLQVGSALASVLPNSDIEEEDPLLNNYYPPIVEPAPVVVEYVPPPAPKPIDMFQRLYAPADRLTDADREYIQRLSPYIANRYRVAEDMTQTIVKNAFLISQERKLDPLLLLAVISVESRFNPVAESSKGAQGLMQVMSDVHTDRFKKYGGRKAALDPLVNMLVGSAILSEYIKKGGGVEGGLKRYVGATGGRSDGGYGSKIATEYARLTKVVGLPTQLFPQSNPSSATESILLRPEENSTSGTDAAESEAQPLPTPAVHNPSVEVSSLVKK